MCSSDLRRKLLRGCLSILPTVHLQVRRAEQHALPGGSGASNIDLFRYGKCIINIDTKVAHRALDLGVAEQELYGS